MILYKNSTEVLMKVSSRLLSRFKLIFIRRTWERTLKNPFIDVMFANVIK